ncbi:hypothetical protein [Bosea massiliensis]|uniref:DivIVA domain-containing protein n=1 Tax=Bosea massiliensis TaxID=151419 RepID=A0ABW0P8Q4_9HYPH
MATRRFTIDPDRVDRFLAAGEAAFAASREFSREDEEIRGRLARLRSKKAEADRDQPRQYVMVDAASLAEDAAERRYEPGQFDAQIAKVEAELERCTRRRAEGAARREHDTRMASIVRDFIGERLPQFVARSV